MLRVAPKRWSAARAVRGRSSRRSSSGRAWIWRAYSRASSGRMRAPGRRARGRARGAPARASSTRHLAAHDAQRPEAEDELPLLLGVLDDHPPRALLDVLGVRAHLPRLLLEHGPRRWAGPRACRARARPGRRGRASPPGRRGRPRGACAWRSLLDVHREGDRVVRAHLLARARSPRCRRRGGGGGRRAPGRGGGGGCGAAWSPAAARRRRARRGPAEATGRELFMLSTFRHSA